MNFNSFFKEVLQHIKLFGWNFMNVFKCMTLSQNPYQLYNFFLCWNVIVVLAFQEVWGFIFREKKLCAYFLVSKFTHFRPQLPFGPGFSGKITFSVSKSCIYTGFCLQITLFYPIEERTNVLKTNFFRLIMYLPFLKDSSTFDALC